MNLTTITRLDVEPRQLLLRSRVIDPARSPHIVTALDRLRSSAVADHQTTDAANTRGLK